MNILTAPIGTDNVGFSARFPARTGPGNATPNQVNQRGDALQCPLLDTTGYVCRNKLTAPCITSVAADGPRQEAPISESNLENIKF